MNFIGPICVFALTTDPPSSIGQKDNNQIRRKARRFLKHLFRRRVARLNDAAVQLRIPENRQTLFKNTTRVLIAARPIRVDHRSSPRSTG